jgi:ribosome biogenesis GTPase
VADTPGFSSFDADDMELIDRSELQYTFREFAPFLDKCQYTGCAHIKEKGCAVLEALAQGKIHSSRHSSYVRLFQQSDARGHR